MIYCFLANGFEEIEALTPVDLLRRCGKDVVIVGVGEEIISGSHNINICADITAPEIVYSKDIEMIILPGGKRGVINMEMNDYVKNCIDYCMANNILIGAICAAPSFLGHKKLLDGKTVTCYPGFETQLGNANYTGNVVERDGNIITARGAGVSMEFGMALVEALMGKEKVEELSRSIVCK